MPMTRKAHILALHNDPDFGRSLEAALAAAGHRVTMVPDEPAALERGRTRACDVALLDLDRSGSGLAFVESLKTACPELPVAVAGRDLDVDTIIGAMRRGVWEVLRKPCAPDDVLRLAERAARIK